MCGSMWSSDYTHIEVMMRKGVYQSDFNIYPEGRMCLKVVVLGGVREAGECFGGLYQFITKTLREADEDYLRALKALFLWRDGFGRVNKENINKPSAFRLKAVLGLTRHDFVTAAAVYKEFLELRGTALSIAIDHPADASLKEENARSELLEGMTSGASC
eukprot:GHVU01163703.1.p2 GENE.GHVU01163703.1~~GHVU01163703.1.p2  ORF type:complete len:160 (-),score=15.91 GHVU01163703.1:1144-1623(-)